MKKQTLEQWWLAFGKSPPGYLRLQKFCHQVENGEVPDQQLLDDSTISRFISLSVIQGGGSKV